MSINSSFESDKVYRVDDTRAEKSWRIYWGLLYQRIGEQCIVLQFIANIFALQAQTSSL